jgi:hypothetical protein
VAPTVIAETAVLGGCAKVLDYAAAEHQFNASTVTNGWTATVRGADATYGTTKGTGTAVYVGGHWVFAQNSGSTSTSTNPSGDDAAAQELAHTAQVAIETCATDNNGDYDVSGCNSPSGLQDYEATIPTTAAGGNAYLSSVMTPAAGGYTVTTTTSNGMNKFSITRNSTGSLSRTCAPVGQGDCTPSSGWDTATTTPSTTTSSTTTTASSSAAPAAQSTPANLTRCAPDIISRSLQTGIDPLAATGVSCAIAKAVATVALYQVAGGSHQPSTARFTLDGWTYVMNFVTYAGIARRGGSVVTFTLEGQF